MPQRLSALEIDINLGFDFADDGQAAVDFGDDPVLLDDWRKRHGQSLDIAHTQMLNAAAHCDTINQVFDNRRQKRRKQETGRDRWRWPHQHGPLPKAQLHARRNDAGLTHWRFTGKQHITRLGRATSRPKLVGRLIDVSNFIEL